MNITYRSEADLSEKKLRSDSSRSVAVTLKNGLKLSRAGSELYAIVSKAFKKQVANLVLPEGVTTLGMYSFKGCGSLTSVVLPESLRDIWIEAFSQCGKLKSVTLEEVTFAGCPQTLGGGLFSKCPNTLRVVAPQMPLAALPRQPQTGGGAGLCPGRQRGSRICRPGGVPQVHQGTAQEIVSSGPGDPAAAGADAT